MSNVVQAPGFSQWWAIRRQYFNDEFQAFLDSKVAGGAASMPALFGAPDCANPS
jgi:hypothetical protein